MSRYKKISFFIIGIELLVCVFCNVVCLLQTRTPQGRLYRVEAARIVHTLEEQPEKEIELYAKALMQHLYDTDEKEQEALRGIVRNVDEIKQYVSGISQASREDFLELEVKPGEFYLSEVMDKIDEYYRRKLAVVHTDFSIGQMSDCLLKGDRDRVIEVLQNLMENAVKYGDGDYVHIAYGEEEDCKLIHVKNSGCSLKKEELPYLFDSFYRGSNSTNEKGSGLGLYISKSLMRKMDGDVFARIEENCFVATVVIRKA